ncbi:MAG: TIGR01777 family oxidoreductase [Deltaproteobacteria bacterium]|nr:TIGR01777 family oxidoreductase [Deltaproteobacteria bacterium]
MKMRGHRVSRMVRGRAAEGEITWDPGAGVVDMSLLEGHDAVINLSGENIAAGRWNSARKKAIYDSRVGTTGFLARTLAALERPPRVLVSSSAVGIYGDRGEERLGEESPPGEGFLAGVCRDWEAAAEPALRQGIRVVALRTGVVLAAEGGALPRMLPPFRLALGGPLGSGRQFMSWIHLDDLLGCMEEAVKNESLAGPVNATAPHPVSNREFTATLARALHRPAVLPLPALVLELLLGEMGRELLLQGQRVIPDKLLRAGFSFRHPHLPQALEQILA